MKRILLCLFIAGLCAAPVHAQSSATQQQIDELNGRIQTLLEGQAANERKLAELSRSLSELREKVSAPAPNDFAGRDDVKRLAETVRELAGKQQADKEHILESIRELGKTITDVPPTSGKRKKNSAPKNDPKPDGDTKGEAKSDAPATPQVGHEYKVKAGDSLGAIVKAYRDAGVKVTTTQILKANPGLDPNKLYVDKVIFIPDPAAK